MDTDTHPVRFMCPHCGTRFVRLSTLLDHRRERRCHPSVPLELVRYWSETDGAMVTVADAREVGRVWTDDRD